LEREKLVKEILETERSYVCSLSKTLELYYYPLTKQLGHVIANKEKSTLFTGLVGIYELHKNLLNELEARLLKWHSEQLIADIFINFAPLFKIYTHYTSKYESAMQTFAENREKPAFKTFCEIRRKDPYANGQTLPSFLIMPIQRIPRYTLLLGGVLKHTAPEHPDYKNLQVAGEQMASVANYLNQKVREQQETHKLKLLNTILLNVKDLIQPDRFLLKDGRMQYTEPFQAQLDTCVTFLFTDLWIHALFTSEKPMPANNKKSSALAATVPDAGSIASAEHESDILAILDAIPPHIKYEARYVFPLERMIVTPIAQHETAFKIQCNEVSCSYICASAKDRNAWLDTLNKALQEVKKRKESFSAPLTPRSAAANYGLGVDNSYH